MPTRLKPLRLFHLGSSSNSNKVYCKENTHAHPKAKAVARYRASETITITICLPPLITGAQLPCHSTVKKDTLPHPPNRKYFQSA